MGDGVGQTILCTKRCRYQKNDYFAFLRPSLGGLGATYAVHLRLIGKPVVDFLLVITELFFARCYASGATSEYRLQVAVFEGGGSLWPKISGRRGRPHQPFVYG